MGFFKKVFGNAVEEVKKNLEDSKNEMLKNLEDKKNEVLKNLNDKKDETLGKLGFKLPKSSNSLVSRRNNDDDVSKQVTAPKPKGSEKNKSEKPNKPKVIVMSAKEQHSGKQLCWVNYLELLYNGSKYALKYTGEKRKTTQYIYDDVDLLNKYQARIAQKQADGSMLYGVVCTCGGNFLLTNCEYTKVTFLDGDYAVLVVDEDGDKYAIDRWGKPYALELYRKKVKEEYK